MERLGKKEGNHHIVILPATPRRYMIDKIPYLYRQVIYTFKAAEFSSCN